jgi:hypothetical protein
MHGATIKINSISDLMMIMIMIIIKMIIIIETTSKSFTKSLRNKPGTHGITERQKTAIMCTEHILKKVLMKSTKHSAQEITLHVPYIVTSGFGGPEVAYWPLVPKLARSNPAEAVGFCRRKNPQHAFLRRGSKAVCPMSCFTACKRNQK